ncbi:MAG: putative sortase-sorted surface protein [Candidatus Saccharibacteria bacterium]|nr:putative sortase-sorted surface protein [Candidatus Saccharibacteria bacterium]MDB5180525.1 putative sortase-sorted surface protein [Candidatus Saccharibacteria bacterium]
MSTGFNAWAFIIVTAFAALGSYLFVSAYAGNPTVTIQTENGTLAGCTTSIADTAASAGGAIRFGDCTNDPTAGAGAQLPISYSLASLSGSSVYIAPTGSDTNSGTVGSPFATLAKAISTASNGSNIVIRGGTYRDHVNVKVPLTKTLKLIAYPGETPVFNGAQTVSGGWVTDGSLRYIAYTPRPVADGSGISFTTGQNLTGDGVGKYPDQAWIGSTQLRQVSARASVVNGTFWVDQTNDRLYMTATNAAQANIEVSDGNRFLYVDAPNTTVEGVKVTRYSNNGADYGVMIFATTADNTVMRNVEISDSAYLAVLYDGSSNRNNGSLMDHVTLNNSNWMGMSLNGTDNFTIQNSRLTNMNSFNEFTFSPQSGAVKAARTWHTKILSNVVSGNNSHGIWFDISNYHTIIASNSMTNNAGSTVFYEISDDLLLIDNYIASSTGQPVKLAGSSGLKLINNTIIGGTDPVGVYTDERSMAGCSNPENPPCGPWGNMRDSYHLPTPDTLDWIPRIDSMFNNIIAYPTSAGYCGVVTPVCITQRNTDAYVPIQTTIHVADSSRGIPRTQINGNVYANGSSYIFSINEPSGRYTTTSAFSTAMAGSPVSISGFESAGRYGNSYVQSDGTPTASLAGLHGSAVAVPANADMNMFIMAGTRHYGVTWK